MHLKHSLCYLKQWFYLVMIMDNKFNSSRIVKAL